MAAINFIEYGTATPWQSRLISAIRQHCQSVDELQIVLDKMNAMNDDSNFAALESQFGIVAGKGDDARDELASYLGKLQTDASVSSVMAARKQMLAKMG